MYNPNTVADSLEYEAIELPSEKTEDHETELAPAAQFVFDIGTQLGDLRRVRLSQEEAA